MKIWIDGYEANVPQRLGSSQVAFELLRNLEKLDKKNQYTILLPDPPLSDLPKEREGWKYKLLTIKKFKTYIGLPLALFLAKEKPDLFFSPTHYAPFFSPVKRIITIFDLAYLRFPQFFKPRDLYQMKLWTRLSITNSSHIITISKSSQKDLIKFYQVPNDKITVAYPGFDKEVFYHVTDQKQIKNILHQYNIDGEYVIFIGTLQPRKNLIRLMQAFTKIENLKLVIVGKTSGLGRQGWMYKEILQKPKELGIEDKVIFTGFTPTSDLPILLSGAKAFILPSLWEGFGIPVLEAMACGTPAIVADVSSLPEVVGPAGIKIDPNSTNQIEQAIRLLAFDQKLRVKKVKESLKRARQFSWRKMAKIVMQTFEKVGQK